MVRNNCIRALIRVLVLTLMMGVLGGRAFGQYFTTYTGYGVLDNGWQNGSNFGGVNLQVANPTLGASWTGANSCGVTYTAAGQIAQFNFPNGFQAANIYGVLMYVYEPATSGRTVNISINVNGVQSPAVSMTTYIQGTAAANTWMPVLIPLSAFGVPNFAARTITNIQLVNGVSGAQTVFYVGALDWFAWPATLVSPTINVNPSVQLSAPLGPRVVDQKMSGVNTAVWDSGFTTYTAQDLIGRANFRTFRFPGGSLSDTYHWQTNLTDGNPNQWPTDFDQFAASPLVHNSGGQDFVTVNYGSGSAAEAALWVQYSNFTKGYHIKYWEVGNENYGTWENDTHASPHDPVTYAQQFALYYNAMKSPVTGDPTIKVGAVIVPGEDSFVNYPSEVVKNPVTNVNHSGWSSVMLSTLKGLGVTPDFVIYHRYPEYNVDCDYSLLTGTPVSTPTWASDTSNIRTMLNDYLSAGATAGVQIMCTENNADAGTPGKQLTSLTNALYMADSFGQVLSTTEASSYLFWDWMNGQGANPSDGPWLYGWRAYGDEGIISTDFTQQYPTFFAEQLVNLFALAGDQVVSASSNYGMVTAYATKRADGTVRVMVINLADADPFSTVSPAFTTTLNFGGTFRPQGTAVEYQYGIPQDNAANPKNTPPQWPQLAYKQLTGTGLSNRYTFPPYSITVILYTPQGQVIPHPPLWLKPPPKTPIAGPTPGAIKP